MDSFLDTVGVGIRPLDDPFFTDSYNVCKVFQRKGITVEDEEALCHTPITEFPCAIAGCYERFQTLIDYDMHYNGSHRYVCDVCKIVLENPRLLDIHIQEHHDSLFNLRSQTQPMHQCYVSECELKFEQPEDRRQHCIKDHKFPANFRFNESSTAKKKREKSANVVHKEKSKTIELNKNQRTKMFISGSRNITLGTSKLETVQSNPSDAGTSKSSLIFIPRQISKSYTKLVPKNKSNEKVVLETVNVMDTEELISQ